MLSNLEKKKLKILLSDTLFLLCQNSLPRGAGFSIEAIVGLTLANDDILLVSLNKTVSGSEGDSCESEALDRCNEEDDACDSQDEQLPIDRDDEKPGALLTRHIPQQGSEYRCPLAESDIDGVGQQRTSHPKKRPINQHTSLLPDKLSLNHEIAMTALQPSTTNFATTHASETLELPKRTDSDDVVYIKLEKNDADDDDDKTDWRYTERMEQSELYDGSYLTSESTDLSSDMKGRRKLRRMTTSSGLHTNNRSKWQRRRTINNHSRSITIQDSQHSNTYADALCEFEESLQSPAHAPLRQLHAAPNLCNPTVPPQHSTRWTIANDNNSMGTTPFNGSTGLKPERSAGSLQSSVTDANGEFSCNICGALLKGRQTLNDHIRGTHYSLYSCACCYCGRSFKWRSGLSNHKLTCPAAPQRGNEISIVAPGGGSVVGGTAAAGRPWPPG